MGGTWWSEDFARKAILQLDRLAIDDDLFGPGRRSVACAAISHILASAEREETKERHKNVCRGSNLSANA